LADMTGPEFHQELARLNAMDHREDFETALCDLYVACEPEQRAALRRDVAGGLLRGPTTWRFPTAYFRSDLTTAQRARQLMIRKSITGGGADHRDDLCDLAWCYHTLRVLGLDAPAFFEMIGRLSDPAFATFVRAFVGRSPENNSLEAFGLRIVETSDGPAVERWR
jgi:hypothetical protein